jgi:outer membrane receptor protein involved in Fe transport
MEGNVMNVGLTYNNFTFSRESESKISNFYGEPFQTNKVSKNGFSVNPQSWQLNIGDRHVFNNNQQHYLSVDATFQVRQGPQINRIETNLANSSWSITGQDTIDQKTEIIEDGKRLRIELDYMQPVGDNFIVEAGYTLRSDVEDQEFLLYNRDFDADVWTEVIGSDDFSHYSRVINAGWALFKGKIIGLNVSGGLRIEHTDRHVETEKDNYSFDYNYLGRYPSFAISKEFLKGNTLQASYSKRIERPKPWHLNPFPRLSDGYSIYIPNPELEPEYASAWELNYQKSLGGISFLSLETFYHLTKNKIERLDITDSDTLLVFTRTNLNSDKRFGAELGGQIKVTDWFSFMPGLTAYYYEAEGDIKGESRSVNDVIFNGRLTTNFNLPTKTRLQLLGFYRGPEVEISEEEQAMYWISAAVRQEFMDRKLSVSLRVDDIFSTRIRKETSYSENSFIYSEGSRKSPVFVLSLTLLLNQNPEKRNGLNGTGRNNGDGGGGMDMDF